MMAKIEYILTRRDMNKMVIEHFRKKGFPIPKKVGLDYHRKAKLNEPLITLTGNLPDVPHNTENQNHE